MSVRWVPTGLPQIAFTDRAPTNSDDRSIGARIGADWVWESAGRRWTCQDDTVGAAVWVEMQGAAGAQPLSTKLSALAGLDTVAGAVEQVGPDSFAKRPIGGGGGTHLLTRDAGDARYVRTYPAALYGALGDGTTNDRAAIQAAIDAASANGGGVVELDAKRYVVSGADLTIKSGVVLIGGAQPWQAATGNTNWGSPRYAILLDSGYSLRLQERAGLQGVTVLRQGLVSPTTVREAMDAVAAFAGTAIRVGDNRGTGSPVAAGQCAVRDVAIFGFAQGIDVMRGARFTGENIVGDCLGGIWFDRAADIVRCYNVHWNSFVTGRTLTGSQTVTISTLADNGSGAVRLTLAAAHPFVTGEYAQVYGVTGGAALTGRWQVTVINSTTLDLVGSTYVGGMSGGTVRAYIAWRDGIAFETTVDCDFPQFDQCMEYGHATGFKLDGVGTTLSNCFCDGLNAIGDQGIGFHLLRHALLTNCWASSKGRMLVVNAPDTTSSIDLANVDVGSAEFIAGDVTMIGGALRSSASIADTMGTLNFANVSTVGCTITGSATALRKLNVVGGRRTLADQVLVGDVVDLRARQASDGGEKSVLRIRENDVRLLGGPSFYAGTGSPEGVVTAVRGSLYLRTDGGAATSLYVKESGTGNTGWAAK
jgi:hypothetical protein